MRGIKTYVIILIGAIILQFCSLETLEGSFLSNLPILGDILTFFDVIVTFYYMRVGLTDENVITFFMRVISLLATIYTITALYRFRIHPNSEEEYLFNILIFPLMTLIHAGFIYIFKSICFPIFDLADKTVQLIDVTGKIKSIDLGK